MNETRTKKELLEILLYHSNIELKRYDNWNGIEAGFCTLIQQLFDIGSFNEEEYDIINKCVRNWVDLNNKGKKYSQAYLFDPCDWKSRITYIKNVIKTL